MGSGLLVPRCNPVAGLVNGVRKAGNSHHHQGKLDFGPVSLLWTWIGVWKGAMVDHGSENGSFEPSRRATILLFQVCTPRVLRESRFPSPGLGNPMVNLSTDRRRTPSLPEHPHTGPEISLDGDATRYETSKGPLGLSARPGPCCPCCTPVTLLTRNYSRPKTQAVLM